MNAPLCPVHQKPMRAGIGGSFYCTAFLGVGVQGANAKGYCAAKALAAPPAPSMAASKSASTVWTEPKLRVEALRFVGQVMQGSSSYDTTLMRDMAREMLAFLRGEE